MIYKSLIFKDILNFLLQVKWKDSYVSMHAVTYRLYNMQQSNIQNTVPNNVINDTCWGLDKMKNYMN